MKTDSGTGKKRVTFWGVFRLIFVIFSFYLLRDAFYRWDGFRYYASFSEFLPSVALVSIFWSIAAVVTAIFVWLTFSALDFFCFRVLRKIKTEQMYLFRMVFLLLGGSVWVGKRLIFSHIATSMLLKAFVLFCVLFTAIVFTWLMRNKSKRWMQRVLHWISFTQEHITPLVWIFGVFVMISLPLVAYHAWLKGPDKPELIEATPSFVEIDNRPNIILVTFDALTARDMSAYGYERLTTPFISKWSKKASLFTRVQSESNITAPATASLMTGKRLWTHQTYHPDNGTKPVKGDVENLALVLKNNEYYTMAFIANPVASVSYLGIADSFDVAPPTSEFSNPVSIYEKIDKFLYRYFGNKIKLHNWAIKKDFILHRVINIISQNYSLTIVPPEIAFNRFLWVIDENPPEPYFAWIHLLPPHDPYLPPEPHMRMFDSSSKMITLKEQEKLIKTLKGQGKKINLKDFPKEMQPTVDILRGRYNEFIRYCDEQFEDFIAELTKRNKLKNTVIILSSDHGESFEHNYLLHYGPHLYEQMTNIPLIVKESDQRRGQIIHKLIEQIDIPATILDLAKIPLPSWMEGRSFLSLMHGNNLKSRSIFSMALHSNPSRGHQITKGTIAVWEGDFKLIHYLEDNKSLLFNLKHDPNELNNLFDEEPEMGQRLLTLIKNNLKKANERIKKDTYWVE